MNDRDFWLQRRRCLLDELARIEREHLPDKYAERQQAERLLAQHKQEVFRVLSTQAS